ncbi:MAG TPA: hypothetical protein VF169_12680 [Albitalea sp.]|uniref:hypothetical protein n=1 Tax=Piscinibacter sp. TaxID=1903157 RepID=UPI002ED39ED3
MSSIATHRRVRAAFTALVFALTLTACGGGGGAAGTNPATTTTYSSVAMAGELIDYSIDTTNLAYTYTITESQFGLTGKTGSGTLTRNADGSYTPSGVPNARVVVLPNGMLIGAVREQFGASVITVPIIGLSNPVSSASALAATYNYVTRGCLGIVCASAHGTFAVGADSTWTSCPNNNLIGGSCPVTPNSGTLTSLGNGRWRVMHNGTDIGTAIGFSSAGQNVLIVDLKDRRAGGFGIGAIVGAQQTTMTTAQTDGTWIAGSTAGHWAVFTATGTSIAFNSIDGVPSSATTSFSPNVPWTGLATTPAGGVAILAGAGVYVLETAGGQAEIGVKIH